MTGPLLELRGVEVTYRRRGRPFSAIRDVDLTVSAGERVGVVGGSGSGKTTIARALLGLVRPSRGEVLFAGTRIDGLPERELAPLRSAVSMVFQDPNSSLNPRMDLRGIVSEPLRSPLLRARGSLPPDSDDTVAAALEAVGLDASLMSRYPHQLSGGQRQRVAMARALVSEPQVLIADEPVSALDVSVRAQVLNLLSDAVSERGLGLVLVSHDLAIVKHLCDRVVVVERGTVVETGFTSDLFRNPTHPYTRELLAATLPV
ncbi:ATP-binding cassette domain-containing protein [Tessaracoccus sp. OS52]|uniref:ABC transporter ATP-binding protein n=1 Tax=Tessaracoccus sp. OS52 TaxID=2886691 RepID=UPI001D118907|nr:ATP-binding cassette domain-containing protein [Tessaracoccus sp. OS52]MCC2593088.1 ATP-binding cassette domain-containing protein [Tessaracoccus sp. OS52]